ncbi:DUF4062 domain-containing protein [Ruegeria hyattellae]|uniref:DUF4062 domain-containing protein n=1 Tax=Ruegeria hyattellae TaxID=3233337 RepID=UPI00355C9A1B
MSFKAEIVRVFLASPSDVDAEREVFLRELSSFNSNVALKRAVYFWPIYWEEIAPGGNQRPQARIIQSLEKCDFLVLLMWKRWGSPTGHDEHTSGSEEEYKRAREIINDPNMPMRDIAVLFKDIDQELLADPGKQLGRVIEFRKKFQDERLGISQPFDDLAAFKSRLQSLFNQWLNDIKDGVIQDRQEWQFSPFASKHINHLPFPGESGPEVYESAEFISRIEEADKRADDSDIEGARRIYAELLAIYPNSFLVLSDCAKFLYRIGEYSNAAKNYHLILERCGDTEVGWKARANANLSTIEVARGNFRTAEELITHSLVGNEELGHELGKADSLRCYGRICRLNGDFVQAEQRLYEALSIFDERNYDSGKADALNELALTLQSKGKFVEAEAKARISYDINVRKERISCSADNLNLLARNQMVWGRLDVAKQLAEEAKEINVRLNRKHGVVRDLLILGDICLARFDFDGSKHFLRNAKPHADYIADHELRPRVFLSLATVASLEPAVASLESDDEGRSFDNYMKTVEKLIGDYPSAEVSALINLVKAQKALKEWTVDSREECREFVLKSRIFWEDIDNEYLLARCCEIEARLSIDGGDSKPVIANFEKAISHCKNVGAELDATFMRHSLSIWRSKLQGLPLDIDELSHLESKIGDMAGASAAARVRTYLTD